jgi:hypothetical protein
LSTEQQEQPANDGQQSTTGSGPPPDILPKKEPPKSQSTKPDGKISAYLKSFGRFLIKPKTILEIAALLVVICYTNYSGQQVQTMSDTLSEIRKQTNSAQRQAHDADKALASSDIALRVQHRAYVVFQDALMTFSPDTPEEKMSPLETKLIKWTPNAGFTVAASFKNVGNSQAGRVRFAINMELAEQPDRQHIAGAQEACFNHARALAKQLDLKRGTDYGNDMAPQQMGASLGLNYKGRNQWSGAMGLSQKTINRLIADEVMIIVAGIINYDDIFNSPHETEFCIAFANTNPRAYSFCGAHNRIR